VKKCTLSLAATLLTDPSAALRELLPSHFEFVFVDGTTSCNAAPGVAEIYPAPYRGWYKTPPTENVAKARKFILSFAEENGPFEIIMGFSQVESPRNR
jgi:hypothetical protein